MATYKPKYVRPVKYPPGTINIDIISLIIVLLIAGFLFYLIHRYWLDNKHQHHHHHSNGGPRPFDIGSQSYIHVSENKPSTIFNGNIGGISTRLDVFNDPYMPPVKMDGYVWEKTSGDVRGLPPIVSPIEVPISPPVVRSCGGGSGYLPVNVETRGVRSDYTQIGILTKSSGGSNKFSKRKMFSDDLPEDGWEGSEHRLILPLMGRRCLSGRDKWQYYTISNTGVVNTKLPIKVRGRNCSSEYGCDEIMEGDMVYVQGYNHGFQATVYENATFSYIPVL